MDSGLSTGTHQHHDGLRERNNVSQSNDTAVPDALTATGEVEPKDKAEGSRKAFGRTPGGTGMFVTEFLLLLALISAYRLLSVVVYASWCILVAVHRVDAQKNNPPAN